jgi:hypothetical protein
MLWRLNPIIIRWAKIKWHLFSTVATIEHILLAYHLEIVYLQTWKRFLSKLIIWDVFCLLRKVLLIADIRIRLDQISSCIVTCWQNVSFPFSWLLYIVHVISAYPCDEHFSNPSAHSVGAPSSSLWWEVEGTNISVYTVEMWHSEGYDWVVDCS